MRFFRQYHRISHHRITFRQINLDKITVVIHPFPITGNESIRIGGCLGFYLDITVVGNHTIGIHDNHGDGIITLDHIQHQ